MKIETACPLRHLVFFRWTLTADLLDFRSLLFGSRRRPGSEGAETAEDEDNVTDDHTRTKQTTFKDYFREGSVRGSIFNLCSATLGAGALSIPSAFAGAGLIPN